MQGLDRLGELVASSRAAFGVRFDPLAERLALVDERGQIIHDDRALLVVMDLVAAERRSGRAAVPVTTTRIAEQVAAFHGATIEWTATAATGLSAAAARPGVIFAGDGRGGFVVPEFSAAIAGVAAFASLLGLVARTKLTMSEIDARIPAVHVLRRAVPTPWAAKGTVMRAVLEAARDRLIDTTDGVRVVEPDGRWVLVLPDPTEPITHLWAEAGSDAEAEALLDQWSGLVEVSHDA
jgi:mannose-1-phosphate guanylyltransferase/phosphomannomutase